MKRYLFLLSGLIFFQSSYIAKASSCEEQFHQSKVFSRGSINAKGGKKHKSRSYFMDDKKLPKKSYLVEGDKVILPAIQPTDTVCVLYVSPKKNSHQFGLQPKDSIVITQKELKVEPADFVGEWFYESGNESGQIKFVQAPSGKLGLSGSSTWVGSGSNANVGEIEGLVTPTENYIKFKDDSCEVEIRNYIDLLFVSDNYKCGGVNVSFSGEYLRSSIPTKK